MWILQTGQYFFFFFFCYVDVSSITFASHSELSETTNNVFDVNSLSVPFFPILSLWKKLEVQKAILVITAILSYFQYQMQNFPFQERVSPAVIFIV